MSLLVVLAVACSACSGIIVAGHPAPPGYGYGHAEEVRIPPGHMPPPGECRVWYPGSPPGHQPPPGPCNADVPPGAWLLYRPDTAKHVVRLR